MSLSDSQRIPYFVRDGVLRINGALKYNDRELRLATMLLLNGSHPSVVIDASRVPSLCSPEIQFFAKLAESAKSRGKRLRLRLSKAAHELVRNLEVIGLLDVEEVEVNPLPPPGTDTPKPAAKPDSQVIRMPYSKFLEKK